MITNNKMTLQPKMVKFENNSQNLFSNYNFGRRPIMFYKNHKKPSYEAGGPFWRNQLKKPTFFTELDPGTMEYSIPDFGFADSLNLRTNDVWQLMYDHIKKVPKYERLKNIIMHLAKEKENALKKKKLTWVADSDPNANSTVDKNGKTVKAAQVVYEDGKKVEKTEKLYKERFINPITGVESQKVSSESILDIWTILEKMLVQNANNVKKIEHLKYNYNKQLIIDLIEELDFQLSTAK